VSADARPRVARRRRANEAASARAALLPYLRLVRAPAVFSALGDPIAGLLLDDDDFSLAQASRLSAASAMLFMHAQFVLGFGFSMIVLLVLLRLLTRRTWIALMLWVPLSLVVINAPTQSVALFILLSIVTLMVFFRLGVLGLMVVLGLSGMQAPVPAALSPSLWYSGPMWLFLAVFTTVVVYGFTVSLGGRRAFARILAEE